jgi:hypothetical protein
MSMQPGSPFLLAMDKISSESAGSDFFRPAREEAVDVSQ